MKSLQLAITIWLTSCERTLGRVNSLLKAKGEEVLRLCYKQKVLPKPVPANSMRDHYRNLKASTFLTDRVQQRRKQLALNYSGKQSRHTPKGSITREKRFKH